MCVCGRVLGADPTVKLPAGHVILDAQQQVLDVINDDNTSFGVFEGKRSCARDVLAAARSLASRVLNYASTHGLVAVASAEVSWPIADDGEGRAKVWASREIEAVASEERFERESAIAGNRNGSGSYCGPTHSAIADHTGCWQPRPSVH
jgi:hypothetical protein